LLVVLLGMGRGWVATYRRRRRRRYLFGSKVQHTNDNIKHKFQEPARLPENPEVNNAGHPNTYSFLFIMKLQLQLRNSAKKHTKTDKNKMSTQKQMMSCGLIG